MGMWIAILGVLIVMTAAGLVYLSARARVFLPARAARNDKKRFWLCFFAVFALFAAVTAWLNLMNSVVCLLHAAGMWLICDGAFALLSKTTKKHYSPRLSGTIALTAALLILIVGWRAAHTVRPVFYTVETEKDVAPTRIVLFADSHIGTTFDGKGFEKHVDAMQKFAPDAVVIAGDFVDDDTSQKDMLDAAKALGKLKTRFGAYFVFGNHDNGYRNPAVRGFTGTDLADALKRNGVTVLRDETALLGDGIVLIGRKDASEHYFGRKRATMDELTARTDKNKFAVVADHQPNDYKNQQTANVDLVLSGHTHGGQLFPLNKAGEWIGANDKTYGHERRGTTDFVVTSGISDWTIKFKTGCRSEFAVIDIKKK